MNMRDSPPSADPAIPTTRPGISLGRVFVLALRELRSGLNGFYIFIACVALGVAVITTVGALSDALHAGFESQGRTILFVSHDMDAVRHVTQRAIWLDHGRVRADGPVGPVVDEYLAEVRHVE